jgi:hypothetical protein
MLATPVVSLGMTVGALVGNGLDTTISPVRLHMLVVAVGVVALAVQMGATVVL